MIEFLVEKGLDLNRKSNGRTVLQEAVKQASETTVLLLFKNGARPNLRNDAGESALWETINSSSTLMVELLLQKEPDESTEQQRRVSSLVGGSQK
jgi:FOG: Ankyrin repeat